jgi:hypothetical protein
MPISLTHNLTHTEQRVRRIRRGKPKARKREQKIVSRGEGEHRRVINSPQNTKNFFSWTEKESRNGISLTEEFKVRLIRLRTECCGLLLLSIRKQSQKSEISIAGNSAPVCCYKTQELSTENCFFSATMQPESTQHSRHESEEKKKVFCFLIWKRQANVNEAS